MICPMTLAPSERLRLTAPSVSSGDKAKLYPAGAEFRFRRAVTDLPDLAEVRAAMEYGVHPKPRLRLLVTVPPLVEVETVTADRSRLLFSLAMLERVQKDHQG